MGKSNMDDKKPQHIVRVAKQTEVLLSMRLIVQVSILRSTLVWVDLILL